MNHPRPLLTILLLLVINISLISQEKIWWGNNMPENWNGTWPEELLTAAERSGFTRTADNNDILDYFAMLQWKSEYVHVFSMYTSDRGLTCPVLVMAKPRISSPREAKESGKPVIYLQGGIHTGENEGKEALLILIRDILFGDKEYLLDNLIIMVAPNFNVDGNETRSVNRGLPLLSGIREDARGYDVNRDAIKLETTSMNALCRNIFNSWDPVLIYDTHRMGGVNHGYQIAYAGSNVPAAHQAPRDFVTYNFFPAITKGARERGGIEIYFHGGFTQGIWPPKEYTHENAIWTTEGKFMVSGYGLRNRMAILVETISYISWEKMIYAQYVCADELLRFSHENGREMLAICRAADEEVVKNIRGKASAGNLTNFVEGRYVSDGKFSMYGYERLDYENIPGTSIRQVKPSIINNPPQLIPNVDLVTKPVGTRSAAVPRGYFIPADMVFIIEKLRTHGLTVTQLKEPVTVSGEEFLIDRLYHVSSGGYNMTRLDGRFSAVEGKVIPAGTYMLDMAQPLANLAFYALEPGVGDGFTGWNLLDDYLSRLGVNQRTVVYPFFKYFKISE
ncbi:MAG: M14 family metallopeptidase [Bacteroidales bacterium]|jgi:hypothetical protein|nr:M14 family metallopeptidase [Bacteroidales bacterium]